MTETLAPAIASLLGSWLGTMGRLSLYGAVLLGVALVADGHTTPFTMGLLRPSIVLLAGGEGNSAPSQPTLPDGVTEPQKISSPAPVYPEDARQQGIEGSVVLDALVGTDGAVHGLKILRSPDGELSGAAEEAVRQWRFRPARNRDGRAVAVHYVLTVRFVLAGAAAREPAATE